MRNPTEFRHLILTSNCESANKTAAKRDFALARLDEYILRTILFSFSLGQHLLFQLFVYLGRKLFNGLQ